MTQTLADRIVANVFVVAAERADSEATAEWVSNESRARFIALINSVQAWKQNDRTVCVSVSGPDENLWGYVASEILDAACADLTTEAGVFDDALITSGKRSAVLTW